MKKLVCLILSAALIFALCITGAGAVEETNVAFGKYVSGEVNGQGNIEVTLGFWALEYLTDGLVPEYPGDNQDRLGWYAGAYVREVDMTVTIDLDGDYDCSRIYLYPQKFLEGTNFPSSYTVEISDDGENWTVVGQEEDLDGARSEPMAYGFESTKISYVKLHVTLLSSVADGNAFYAGLGEIEVYGVEHVEGQTDPGTTEPDPGTTESDPGTTEPDPGTTEPDPGTTEPDPGTTEPQPATGDTAAIFAVVAVIVLAATLVISKKRAVR